MNQSDGARGETLRMGPHALDYPSFACARVVVGAEAVNPDCWEESWIAPFEKILTKVESHISLRGVVFTGAEGHFPSDLDVGILALTSQPKAWEAFCLRLAKCFHRISRMPWHTVACAGARCTGPGFDLALACQARIAASDRDIVLGWPELAYGRIPSFGGTQRLPRLMGLTRAAQWLSTGRLYTVDEAIALGLFHASVQASELAARGLDYAEGRIRPRGGAKLGWFTDGTRFGRRRAFRRIESEILTEVPADYPAPRAALVAARDGLDLPFERAIELEARAGAEILKVPLTQELTRIERLRAAARRVVKSTSNSSLGVTAEPQVVPTSEVIELAAGPQTAPEAFEAARAAVVKHGKIPLRIAVKGHSIVNRILGIQLAEAGRLLAEGLSITEIDAIATGAGMAVGPFALMDGVGLRQVLDMLGAQTAAHGPRFHMGDAIHWLLDADRRGGGGAGFFERPGGAVDTKVAQILGIEWAAAARGPAGDAVRNDAEDRLLLSMAAEGLRALDDRAVDSTDTVDLAAIFGFGYPAFRGGPMRDLTRRGPAGRSRLAHLAAHHGEAFRTPAATLTQIL